MYASVVTTLVTRLSCVAWYSWRLLAKIFNDFFQGRRPGFNNLSGQDVKIDVGSTQFRQHVCDSGLAGCNPAGDCQYQTVVISFYIFNDVLQI